MSLYKQPGSPYYYAEIQVGGRRVRFSTKKTNKVAAEKVHDARRERLRLEHQGILPATTGRSPKWEEFITDYLAHTSSKRSHAADVYRAKHYLTPYFTGRRLRQIDRRTVLEFRAWLATQESRGTRSRGEIIRPATQNRVLALLRAVFAHAESLDLVARSPFRGLKLASERSRSRVLTAEEEASLVAAANPPLRELIIVGLQTAARPGELVGLRWRDVDLDEATVTFGRTKTGRGRTVPLNTRALETLRSLGGSTGLVFGIRNNLWRNFRAAVTRAKLDPDELSPHTLRHTCLSRLAARGVDVRTLQAIGGHASLSALVRYLHSPHAREAVELLDSPLKHP